MSRWLKILNVVVAVGLVLGLGFVDSVRAEDAAVEKRLELREIQQKIDEVEKILDQKRKEALTLQNQIGIIEAQIDEARLQVQLAEREINITEAEISEIQAEVEKVQADIDNGKISLGEAMRASYELRRISLVEVLVAAESLSEFFTRLEYVSIIESGVESALTKLLELQTVLEEDLEELNSKSEGLAALVLTKELEQQSLNTQVGAKDSILNAVKGEEAKYQAELEAAREEQRRVSREIASLISGGKIPPPRNPGDYGMSWPVSPSKGISAGFREPSYAATFGIEHNAIDIPTPQGTPIKAPADGTIIKTRDAGLGYSYIVMAMDSGLVTVYGHVSGFSVSTDSYVVEGQVIGYTGGTPGTAGAGYLTTGPHLHFETWRDGSPVNPLQYLP